MDHVLILTDNLIHKNNPQVLGELIEFSVKEGTFISHGNEAMVFVLHKSNFIDLPIKEIGDGMKIPFIKKQTSYKLNIPSFETGIGIYERFDEQTGENKRYAYGAKSGDIEYVNSVLGVLNSNVKLLPGKFIEIQGMKEITEPKEVGEFLSYFLGLVILYGNFTEILQSISHAVIQLPLVGSISSEEEKILEMIQKLHKEKLFMTYDYQTMKSGQLLQINIDDQEILDIWSEWLGGEKYDQSEVREKLESFEGVDLTNKVLKFLRK